MAHHHSNALSRDSSNEHSINDRLGLKLFLSFFWRNPKLMTIALILLVITSFLVLLPAILIGRSLEILLTEGYTRQFLILASSIVLVAILNYLVSTLSNYYYAITAFALERDVRQEFFDSLVDSSMTFHDRNNSSQLLSLGLNEVHFMSGGAMMVRFLIQSFISIVFVLVYFDRLFPSRAITVAVIIGFILYFILVFTHAAKIGPIRTELSNSLAALTEQSQEIFRGIQVVRSFNYSQREIERFEHITKVNAKLSEKEGRARAFYVPGLILILITASVFTYSLTLVQDGLMSIGTLIEVIGLLLTLQLLNFSIPSVILSVRAGLINADRIANKMMSAKKLQLVEHKGNEKSNQVINNTINEIKFDDVTFAYPGYSKAVLRHLNFTITAGENVVLIGGPGSGKSSLLKLLLGLYPNQHGSISINGEDIKTISESVIRKNI